MTPIDDFLPFVTPHVTSGCPEPLMIQAIRTACTIFCKQTDIVHRLQAPTDITTPSQDYTIAVPENMNFHQLMGVAWQGHWLSPVPPDVVTSDVAYRGADIGTAKVQLGSPRWYFQKTTDAPVVSLYPVPDTTATGVLFIKAAFFPANDALTVDDQLFNDWVTEITSGAVAILKSIHGMPWTSDPAPHHTMFQRGINEAKRQKFFGKMPNGARVLPRSFTGGH